MCSKKIPTLNIWMYFMREIVN